MKYTYIQPQISVAYITMDIALLAGSPDLTPDVHMNTFDNGDPIEGRAGRRIL